MIDNNVEEVRRQLHDRSLRGLNKYGVSTMRTDLSILDWIQHLQEELMDAAVYCEAMKKVIREGNVLCTSLSEKK